MTQPPEKAPPSVHLVEPKTLIYKAFAKRQKPFGLRRAHVALAFLPAFLAMLGCQTPPPNTATTRKPPTLRTPPLPPPPKAGPEMFQGNVIDDLADAEASHFFARHKDAALLVQVRDGKFFSRATAQNGTPKADKPLEIGPAPADGELVVGSLRPLGDGYVLTWAELLNGRSKIATLALDITGAPRGARVTLTEFSEDVLWIDVIPRDGAGLVVWETSQDQSSTVSAIALDAKGTAVGPAAQLLAGALGWEASPTGSLLAAVMPPAAVKTGKKTTASANSQDETPPPQTGKVVIIPLDPNGKPKAPIEISASPTALPDVMIAEIAGKWVVAWTDTREIDAAVWTSVVDKSFAISSPAKRATPPTGEQALVSIVGTKPLAPAAARGLLAWEDVLNAAPESRQIHLAAMNPDGSIGKERATMGFNAAGTAPDIAVDSTGFGAVTLAPAWQGGAPPEEAPVWPTFIRFGADMSVLSAEPVRSSVLANEGIPYFVHSLACQDGACSTLAAGTDPAKVALISLQSRKTEWYSPATRDPDNTPPRAASLTALYSGDWIAHLGVIGLSTGAQMAAWVSYFPEPPPGSRAKQNGEAEVALLISTPDSKPGTLTPIQLSKKAVSVGGIGISPAPGDKKEIAVVWVAREKGDSQVYITKVDETGKKLAQKKITVVPRAKKGGIPSEVSDVSIAWAPSEVGEGWIVSWVDTRDGNAEVYAAKVDRALNKIVPDKRLTDAPGDAAEVTLMVRGKEALIAWSDARNEAAEGRGDIYVARIDTKTLTKFASETRPAASPTHSRTPQLMVAPGGTTWVSWIEDVGENADAGGALRFAVLDDKAVASTVTTLQGTATRPIVSAAIACSDKSCRGVLAKSASEALILDTFTLSPAAQPLPGKTVLTLPGVGSMDISPTFADRDATSLFFGADTSSGTGRVRHMKIEW